MHNTFSPRTDAAVQAATAIEPITIDNIVSYLYAVDHLEPVYLTPSMHDDEYSGMDFCPQDSYEPRDTEVA